MVSCASRIIPNVPRRPWGCGQKNSFQSGRGSRPSGSGRSFLRRDLEYIAKKFDRGSRRLRLHATRAFAMALRTAASRFYLLGWFVAWILSFRQGALVPWLVLLFGASGVIAGLFLFFRGFGLLRQKRWIEDTPVSKIAAAAMGRVKVIGRATGPYTLISPLAGADCYYYRAVAWNGQNAQDEEKVERRAVETIYAPLFIEDETGRLMIDPRGAQLDLPYEYDEAVSGISMTECARRFLRRHGLSDVSNTTVTECVIKPGDPLFVLGTLAENRVGENRYLSAEAADLQRREEMEAMGVPESDLPKASATVVAGFDLSPETVLGKGGRREVFVLSRETPQGMIEDLAKRAVFDIWGGPVLALLSLGLLIRGLHLC